MEIQQKYDQLYCRIYNKNTDRYTVENTFKNTVRYTAGYTYIYGLMYMHVFSTYIHAYTDRLNSDGAYAAPRLRYTRFVGRASFDATCLSQLG